MPLVLSQEKRSPESCARNNYFNITESVDLAGSNIFSRLMCSLHLQRTTSTELTTDDISPAPKMQIIIAIGSLSARTLLEQSKPNWFRFLRPHFLYPKTAENPMRIPMTPKKSSSLIFLFFRLIYFIFFF